MIVEGLIIKKREPTPKKEPQRNVPGQFLVMIQLFPRRRTSCNCMLRLATPRRRCSPACALKSATWSSRVNSLKAGMYLAHSTRIRSCCFILSQTSFMLAICFVLRSISLFGLPSCLNIISNYSLCDLCMLNGVTLKYILY